MKFTFISIRLLIWVLLCNCLLSCDIQKDNFANVSDHLLKLEREAIEREFKNDTSFLSSIMDSTFIELSGDTIKNKHEVLKTIFQDNFDNIKNKISLDSFRLEEPVVHVYDNSSVVTFIIHTFRKKEDSLFERRTRFYDVWIKRGSEWKAVTWQATRL